MGRAWKLCARCPEPVPPGVRHCDDCAIEHERRRGTPTERGYGPEHKRLRREWAPLVEAGEVNCFRATCGEPIEPGTPWDLGHEDNDRTKWTGPEHQACNRATAGR